ncbi:PREDICTED: uncharacterized protein LOC101298758 [Fragaria vesca subsp. vesca]
MIKTLPPLVVMAFTSTKVRRFDYTIVNSGMSTCLFNNPAIPEIEEYRAKVSFLSAKLRLQSSWFNKGGITWLAPPAARLLGWIIILESFVVEIMESGLAIPCKIQNGTTA